MEAKKKLIPRNKTNAKKWKHLKGGIFKYQAGTSEGGINTDKQIVKDAKDWMIDWYLKRKETGNYEEQLQDIDYITDRITNVPVIISNYSMGDRYGYFKSPHKDNKGLIRVYRNPEGSNIWNNNLFTNIIHELGHSASMYSTLDSMRFPSVEIALKAAYNASMPSVLKVNSIIGGWIAPYGDLYLNTSAEIYARLMQMREAANMDPTKKYSYKDMKPWLKRFDLDYGEEKSEALMNDVAHNQLNDLLGEYKTFLVKKGAKIHKPFGHRAITDNGWIPTKRLKKGTYGLIKKHKDGGPTEIINNGFLEIPKDNTYVLLPLLLQKIKYSKPVHPSIKYLPVSTQLPVKDNRSDARKAYDETFTKLGGKDLGTRQLNARTEEANKYIIPYIPEKTIRLTTDRYNTGKISTNLLDSIYDASLRTGVPFNIALGLAGRESTLGIGRGFKKGLGISGTDLYSNWQQIQPILNTNSLIDKANALFARLRNLEQITDEDFVFLTSYLLNLKKQLDSTKPMKENPIDNALKYYLQGKYNPGDKKHTLMVEEDSRLLMSDPAIQKWMKEKGIL